MDVMMIAAFTVIVAILAVILRQQRPEQAMLLVLAAGVAVVLLLTERAGGVISDIGNMLNQSGLSSEYTTILFKGLGICLVTQLASDTCKDAGEAAMAGKAELAGRVALLVIGLPLFQKIASVALTLIGG